MAAPKANANQETVTVRKLTASITHPGGDANWVESDEKFTVIIDKIEFSAGKTKKAHKLRFTHSGAYYAAKYFFDIGSHEAPSSEENLQHLKEELLRQLALKSAVLQFAKVAKENNVPIHDLKIANAFILTECDTFVDRSWLVDPLLDFNKMKKFSGTDTAGSNKDFPGMTCDTFAHFAFADSGAEFVPTDIQGIETEVFLEGLPCASKVILFDLMAHSKLQTMGLGDNGVEGIKLFCSQHVCNEICKKLQLEPVDEILKESQGSEVLPGANQSADGSNKHQLGAKAKVPQENQNEKGNAAA